MRLLKPETYRKAVEARLAGDTPEAKTALVEAVRSAVNAAAKLRAKGKAENPAYVAKLQGASEAELLAFGEHAIAVSVDAAERQSPGWLRRTLLQALGKDVPEPHVHLRHAAADLSRRMQLQIASGVRTDAAPLKQTDRMKVLASLVASAPPVDIAKCPHASRILSLSNLTFDRLKDVVHDGLQEPGSPLGSVSLATMTPEQRAVYFARHRDINNLIWTGACFDVAKGLDAVDLSKRPPHPIVEGSYRNLETAAFVLGMENQRTGDVMRRYANAGTELRWARECVLAAGDGDGGMFREGQFYVRVPVGDFGTELSRALAQAASYAMEVSVTVSKDFAGVDKNVIKWSTLFAKAHNVLREGMGTTATLIGVILAAKPEPPFDDVRAALRGVAKHLLLTRMAGMAPFGSAAPLGAAGIVPVDALAVVHGKEPRLALQKSLVKLADEVKVERQERLFSPELPERWAYKENRTETLRGCPVAGRGPIVNDKGEIEIPERSGLSAAIDAFVELTIRILDQNETQTGLRHGVTGSGSASR